MGVHREATKCWMSYRVPKMFIIYSSIIYVQIKLKISFKIQVRNVNHKRYHPIEIIKHKMQNRAYICIVKYIKFSIPLAFLQLSSIKLYKMYLILQLQLPWVYNLIYKISIYTIVCHRVYTCTVYINMLYPSRPFPHDVYLIF